MNIWTEFCVSGGMIRKTFGRNGCILEEILNFGLVGVRIKYLVQRELWVSTHQLFPDGRGPRET
jgi:hypothetical protein